MRSGHVLSVAVFLLLSSPLYADEKICFSTETAGRIDAELQHADNLRVQIEMYQQANAELETQIKLLKEIQHLQQLQIEAGRSAVESMRTVIKGQAEACDRAVKDARPGFLKSLTDAVGYIGIGILAGVLLL